MGLSQLRAQDETNNLNFQIFCKALALLLLDAQAQVGAVRRNAGSHTVHT